MVVYVDDMYKTSMGKYGRMKMSHMIADTDDELHKMADRIGISRKWYQGDHYDISMLMRARALKYGARPVSMMELGRMIINKRRKTNV